MFKKLCYAAAVGAAIGSFLSMYESKQERKQAALGMITIGAVAFSTYLGAKKAAENAFEDINVQVFIRRDTSSEYKEAQPIETTS